MKVDVARYEYEQLRSRPGAVHGLMQEQRLGMAILETWQLDGGGAETSRMSLVSWGHVSCYVSGGS